jgi:hypothetical protein
MADRNWDKELAKIDKQLESVSDEALFPTKQAATPAAKVTAQAAQQSTRTWGAIARLILSIALGVGILFWPYAARCGAGLAAYLFAVVVVIVGGVWSSVWTWRHRTARAHTLSLLVVLWGLVLGAVEVLPRAGYAKATLERPALWACG